MWNSSGDTKRVRKCGACECVEKLIQVEEKASDLRRRNFRTLQWAGAEGEGLREAAVSGVGSLTCDTHRNNWRLDPGLSLASRGLRAPSCLRERSWSTDQQALWSKSPAVIFVQVTAFLLVTHVQPASGNLVWQAASSPWPSTSWRIWVPLLGKLVSCC